MLESYANSVESVAFQMVSLTEEEKERKECL